MAPVITKAWKCKKPETRLFHTKLKTNMLHALCFVLMARQESLLAGDIRNVGQGS